MERILAIQNHDGLCWKCLNSYDNSNIHIINIPEMGYGSGFDGWSTEIHLCDNCYQESIKDNAELWSMEERHDLYDEGFGEDYKYEDEMYDYINSLPIQGQQFVYNEFINGWNTNYTMDSQDWIDYKLDILPHEKCKEYGYYSPDEKKAYKERFTTCQYPTNRIFKDGSKGCWCPFNAYGKYGQEIDNNISDECYNCKHYIKRTTPIKDINNEDFNDYMEYLRMQIRQNELKEKFGA